jgi:DNA replication protein DnaC
MNQRELVMDFNLESLALDVKEYHYQNAITKLEIGERFNNCFFGASGEILTECQIKAKEWAFQFKEGNKEKPFLLMVGTCGAGKTWAGISALLHLAVTFRGWGGDKPDNWQSQAFGRFHTHYQLAESVFRNDYAEENRRKMLETRVLMLDDLRAEGTGRVSESLLAWMDELINFRYNHNLATILTSNTTTEQFRATYGEKIVDRIQHAGIVLKVNSESLRKEKANA